jgi:hypothetical protein
MKIASVSEPVTANAAEAGAVAVKPEAKSQSSMLRVLTDEVPSASAGLSDTAERRLMIGKSARPDRRASRLRTGSDPVWRSVSDRGGI